MVGIIRLRKTSCQDLRKFAFVKQCVYVLENCKFGRRCPWCLKLPCKFNASQNPDILVFWTFSFVPFPFYYHSGPWTQSLAGKRSTTEPLPQPDPNILNLERAGLKVLPKGRVVPSRSLSGHNHWMEATPHRIKPINVPCKDAIKEMSRISTLLLGNASQHFSCLSFRVGMIVLALSEGKPAKGLVEN